MDFQLPEDEDRDYDTLGGLVFAQLAVIPEDGSRPVVEALGLRIRVEELCDRPGGVGPGGKAGARCCRLRIETRFRTAAALPAAVLFFPPRAGRSERKELHP